MFWKFCQYSALRFLSKRVKRCREKLPIINFGIIAHIDAGKTTTTERMLYNCGAIRVLGNVEDGDTVMDYMQEERERGITVRSAAATMQWKGHKLNIIDTPGHADFINEVQRSVSVLDGVIVVLDATAGIQAQTIAVWRHAMHLPKIVYLNKMDLKSSSIDRCISSLKKLSEQHPLLLYYPVVYENAFGMVDLVTMIKYAYDVHSMCGFPVATNATLKNDGELHNYRIKLLDNLASLDETFASLLLSECSYELPVDEIKQALYRCVTTGKAYPVMIGSSSLNAGVDKLLDAVVYFIPKVKEQNGPVYGKVFKVIYEPSKHDFLSFVRVYGSGSLKKQSIYKNLHRKKRLSFQRIYAPYGGELDEINEIGAGEIGVVAGTDELYSGDIISATDIDIKSEFESPEPVFFCNIESDSSANEKKLMESLSILNHEDPSFQLEFCEDMRTIMLRTMGELHVSIVLSRLRREFNINAKTSPLSVNCFEIPLNESKEIIERSQDGKNVSVGVYVKPVCEDILNFVRFCRSINTSNLFFKNVNIVHSDDNPLQISRDQKNLIDHGTLTALSTGPCRGFRVIGADVYLTCLHTNTNSSFLSFVMSECVRACMSSAQCVVIEPVVKVTVYVVKSEHIQRVLDALNVFKSQIIAVDSLLGKIEARSPLEHLQGFGVLLRSLTSGTGSFHMEVDGFEPISD